MYKYITVDLRNIRGIKRAEWLQARGWKVFAVGFATVTMQKMTKRG